MDVGGSRAARGPARHRHADFTPRLRRSVPPFVTLGRVGLALVPALWVTAYLTRPIWIGAPVVHGLPDHPLAATFFVLSLAIGPFTPLLLLPIGGAGHAEIDPAGALTVDTVLGRRRLESARLARIGALTLPGTTAGNFYFVYLRGERFRWVLLSLGMNPRLPAPLRNLIESSFDERPEALSPRARAMMRIGARPGLRQRFALGTFSYVVGIAALGSWMLLAWTLILVGWMPIT